MKKPWRDVKAGDRVVLTVIDSWPHPAGHEVAIIRLDKMDIRCPVTPDAEVEVLKCGECDNDPCICDVICEEAPYEEK